jgi:hypothetical protein
MDELIAVSKGADYLEVHPTTLKAHKAQGWKECAMRAAAPAPDDAELTGLKAKADALGVGYASNVTAKALANKLAEFEASRAPKAPADMTAAELKGELEAYRVEFKGNASKADLADLVTAARAKAAGSQS